MTECVPICECLSACMKPIWFSFTVKFLEGADLVKNYFGVGYIKSPKKIKSPPQKKNLSHYSFVLSNNIPQVNYP